MSVLSQVRGSRHSHRHWAWLLSWQTLLTSSSCVTSLFHREMFFFFFLVGVRSLITPPPPPPPPDIHLTHTHTHTHTHLLAVNPERDPLLCSHNKLSWHSAYFVLGDQAKKVNSDNLEQWFLTLLEVLNPASFISAFTEPFVIGKIKYDFFKSYFLYSFIHVNPYCIRPTTFFFCST